MPCEGLDVIVRVMIHPLTLHNYINFNLFQHDMQPNDLMGHYLVVSWEVNLSFVMHRRELKIRLYTLYEYFKQQNASLKL